MTKVYSRRTKALRRLGILGLILVMGWVTGAFQVLPSMAVRDLEVSQGIAPTKQIASVYNHKLTGTVRYYLRENEDVLLWGSVRFYPFVGLWQRHFAVAIELEESAPVQVSFESVSNGDENVIYAFGQVREEGDVILQGLSWEDDSVVREFVVPEEDYISHDGKTYFISDISGFFAPIEGDAPNWHYHLRTPEGAEVGQHRLEGAYTWNNV